MIDLQLAYFFGIIILLLLILGFTKKSSLLLLFSGIGLMLLGYFTLNGIKETTSYTMVTLNSSVSTIIPTISTVTNTFTTPFGLFLGLIGLAIILMASLQFFNNTKEDVLGNDSDDDE